MRADSPVFGVGGLALVGMLAMGALGCEGETKSATEVAVAEAQAMYPDYLTLHQQVIARACGPTAGVCHNTKEYPDLHTPANMLGMVGEPCNVAAISPSNVENICEPPGDILIVTSGLDVGFETRIGSIEEVESIDGPDNDGDPRTDLLIHVADAIPNGIAPGEKPANFSVVRPTTITSERVVIAQHNERLVTEPGSGTVRIVRFSDLKSEQREVLMNGLSLADPNADGVFGSVSQDAGLLITPGDPDNSYLLWRVLGEGRAPRMPLAGAPLDEVQTQAVRCWIIGLERVDKPGLYDPIDYDYCLSKEGGP